MTGNDVARAVAEEDAKGVGVLIIVAIVCALALGGSCAIGMLLGFVLRGLA